MTPGAVRRSARTASVTIARPLRWATTRRRRIATGFLLRGICYGLGTSIVSLTSVWIQRHL
ncbi:hypothetical protein ACWGNF_01610 [Streptomyces sp. NPDC055808]|uniref:hypothetical protein n=1 Tax=Streptomyces sp. NPDC001828 TaxID=3364615 RepID=UPI0036BE5369